MNYITFIKHPGPNEGRMREFKAKSIIKGKMKGQKIAQQVLVPSKTNLKTVTTKASMEITLQKEMKNYELAMGFSGQSSSHNRSSVLSFYLIKSYVTWLTTFKEGLVISLTAFDWTRD